MNNVQAFTWRKKFTAATPEEALRISKLPCRKWEDIKDINSDKYDWHIFQTVRQVRKGDIRAGWANGEPEDAIVPNDSKYGRVMYCPKTDTVRSRTMGEFYQGGIVD